MTIYFAGAGETQNHHGRIYKISDLSYLRYSNSIKLTNLWRGMMQTRNGWKAQPSKENIDQWEESYWKYFKEKIGPKTATREECFFEAINIIHPAMDVTFVESPTRELPSIRRVLHSSLLLAEYPYLGGVDVERPKPKNMKNFGKGVTMKKLGFRIDCITEAESLTLYNRCVRFPEVFKLKAGDKTAIYYIHKIGESLLDSTLKESEIYRSKSVEPEDVAFSTAITSFMEYFNGDIALDENGEPVTEWPI